MHRHKTLNGRTPERKTSDTGELGEHEKPLTTDTSAYKLSCLMSHFRERLYLPRGNSFTIYNSNLKCYTCGVKLISRMCSERNGKQKYFCILCCKRMVLFDFVVLLAQQAAIRHFEGGFQSKLLRMSALWRRSGGELVENNRPHV